MVFYDEDNIEKGLTSHFEATSKCCDPKTINEVAELVEGTLDDEMREIMNKDFTKEEVKQALFKMYLAHCRDDVIKKALKVLNQNADLGKINKTLIVLIP